jgi:hypothetical protein
MNRPLFIAFLLFAGVAYACGPRARSSEPPAEQRKAVSGQPVEASLAVTVGKGVEFSFNVTNNAARKVEFLFPSGQTHDLVVSDALGREVWRWSDGRMFTQVLQTRVLESNGTLRWDAAMSGTPLAPGRYTAVATLLSDNRPVEERADFTIPETR